MDEKTQILTYIQKNLNGTFIDIGTGGDAIAILAQQLPKNSRPTLIAADIDPLVIESVTKRRPEITKYINNTSGPKIELVTMSAVDMHLIKDSTIAGISASALAHEVFSYVPNKGGLDQFVAEVCRVLEKEGVFIYRDPKWVDDPETHCTMIIKNNIAKYYLSLFLPKFLDRQFSMLRNYRNECSKPQKHSPNDVKVNIYFKNSKQVNQLSFTEFLNTPSHLIDYSKNFSIEAPKGLIAEMQRHYLMFIKNYYAPGFIDQHHFKDDLNISDLSKEERELLVDFAQRESLPISENIIKKEDFALYCKVGKCLTHLFENQLKISIDRTPGLNEYIKKMSTQNINRNLFFLEDENTLSIDPKMLILLFHGKEKGIFQFLQQNQDIPWDILEHLKLEGEEHYFYKTRDQIIAYVGQLSRYLLKDGHKRGYVLAPISEKHIYEIPRDFYKSILRRDLLVLDSYGNIQEPVTEKNIIHFKVQPQGQALSVYKAIITKFPDQTPELNEWIPTLHE